jgi:hypothetical protein
MKKTTLIIACALLFVSIAGFAQTPSQAPLSPEARAAILGESATTGSCATQPAETPFAPTPPAQAATCSGNDRAYYCCVCNQSNDCFACCICAGNSVFVCARC